MNLLCYLHGVGEFLPHFLARLTAAKKGMPLSRSGLTSDVDGSFIRLQVL